MQQTKHTSTAPWSEFEPAFERLMKITGANSNEIMIAIGYAGASNVARWRSENKVPRRAKYAIVGYLSELEAPSTPDAILQFTFDELIAMFGVLSGWQIPAEVQCSLAKKIARQVTNGAG